MSKVKIVLDADVIIHFAKGQLLSKLPSIFKEYDFVVLRPAYDEVKGEIKQQLDNQITRLHNISLLEFRPTGEMIKEYATLQKIKGQGESACLAYCRFNNQVVGSSNMRDVKEYCDMHDITYLTTIDFLYYAIRRGIISIAEANQFVIDINSKGSRIPSNIDFETYISSANM